MIRHSRRYASLGLPTRSRAQAVHSTLRSDPISGAFLQARPKCEKARTYDRFPRLAAPCIIRRSSINSAYPMSALSNRPYIFFYKQIVVYAVVIFAVWNIPAIRNVINPLKLFTIGWHELCHIIAVSCPFMPGAYCPSLNTFGGRCRLSSLAERYCKSPLIPTPADAPKSKAATHHSSFVRVTSGPRSSARRSFWRVSIRSCQK